MTTNYALFSESLGKRVKTVVESAEKTDAILPAENKARLLAGYTSPVEISDAWIMDGGVWKCRARRLWRIDGTYQTIDDGVEFDLYHPTSAEQPAQGVGERVFAVFRGVWELVSGAAVGGPAPPPQTATVILPICRPINPNAKGDWTMPFDNTYETEHNSRTHYAIHSGYIARDGKTYSPLIAFIDENNVPHYFKNLRVSRDVDHLATQNANAHYNVIDDERTTIVQRPVIIYDEPDANEWKPWEPDFIWETTTDSTKAWRNYDVAACPTLDYSEVLVPGEHVKILRTETHHYYTKTADGRRQTADGRRRKRTFSCRLPSRHRRTAENLHRRIRRHRKSQRIRHLAQRTNAHQ
jgi:hypothetical protein